MLAFAALARAAESALASAFVASVTSVPVSSSTSGLDGVIELAVGAVAEKVRPWG